MSAQAPPVGAMVVVLGWESTWAVRELGDHCIAEVTAHSTREGVFWVRAPALSFDVRACRWRPLTPQELAAHRLGQLAGGGL
jgi:hypothetical protein